ncbi:hypothetical protein K501DRAFT_285056 [Backusella circina FSU 941]|nr:hypothetical protein K501DRAFT_285056 [Backusella circina FSU 941]
MEQTNFQWVNNNQGEIMDSSIALDPLVNQTIQSVPTEGGQTDNSKDILNYLLQPNDIFLPDYIPAANNPISQVNGQQQVTGVQETTEAPEQPMFSVTESKGNFITFMPSVPTAQSTKTKSNVIPKKARFKEPIFVTESPYKSRKKRTAHSSGEDGSDDDIDEDFHHSDPSLKMMTSKEKRQIRNKISARNFRVRRKEYITQLEEKVSEYETIIKQLKEQNDKLQKVNQELMVQVMTQPLTPPSTTEEMSSSSEGYSPHSVSEQPPANMFQFQLDDLYDFSLFSVPGPEESMSVYLNHATMPDWDLPRLLDEKQNASSNLSSESMTELMQSYPLLGPALMSIILRHTLSLEYVNSFADELKAAFAQENDDESKKPSRKLLRGNESDINDSDQETKKSTTEDTSLLSREEIEQVILRFYFSYYAAKRASGARHDDIINGCSDCLREETDMYRVKLKKDAEKQKQRDKKKGSSQKRASLQAYCHVAGKLLRNPQRFAQMHHLYEESRRRHNSNTNTTKKITSPDSLISSFKNIQISSDSTS